MIREDEATMYIARYVPQLQLAAMSKLHISAIYSVHQLLVLVYSYVYMFITILFRFDS